VKLVLRKCETNIALKFDDIFSHIFLVHIKSTKNDSFLLINRSISEFDLKILFFPKIKLLFTTNSIINDKNTYNY